MHIANSRDARALLGYCDRRLRCDGRIGRPSTSAMRSNDDNDWPVHSLTLSIRDLRGLMLPEVWLLAAYHDDRHGRTMIARDVWRLTIKVPPRIFTCCHTYIFVRFVFFVWYGKHPPVAFVLEVLNLSLQIRNQRPAVTSIEQYRRV